MTAIAHPARARLSIDRKFMPLMATVAMFAIIYAVGFLSFPAMRGSQPFFNLLITQPFLLISVVGETFVIISGGIDLSVGGVIALTTVVTAAMLQGGWDPVVAPELEFYLVEQNKDADYPLRPPVGRSGRAEPGRQSYSIAAVNEFDPLFDDIYQFCEDQDIEIDTLIHEDGPAQMEINLIHGQPLDLADQAFLFKRTAREAALRHKMYATFMAKPHAKEPGSAMHIHQSVVDVKSRKNIFSNPDGTPSTLFFNHIGGLQRYLPAAMALFCANVNSYRRLTRYLSAPINVHWGYDNRTAGLRVPMSDAQARRVENRVGGADANPYIAIAASLACGYLGMTEGIQPSDPIVGSAHDLPFGLPRSLDEALRELRACEPLVKLLGEPFIEAFTIVKEAEYEVFLQVISSWEREHLLLNV